MFSFRDFDLPLNTELRSSLQTIRGVGWRKSIVVAAKVGFGYPFFVSNLNFYKFSIVSFLLNNLVISQVRVNRLIRSNIIKLIDMKSRRGSRHKDCMPVRGQRTRTNARVRRRMKVQGRTFGF
jgi:small subunit ribosomal protein S13